MALKCWEYLEMCTGICGLSESSDSEMLLAFTVFLLKVCDGAEIDVPIFCALIGLISVSSA